MLAICWMLVISLRVWVERLIEGPVPFCAKLESFRETTGTILRDEQHGQNFAT